MHQWNQKQRPKPLVVPLDVGFNMIGVGRSTGYKLIETDPTFPKPIQLSPGRKGLIVAECEEYVAQLASRRNAGEAA